MSSTGCGSAAARTAAGSFSTRAGTGAGSGATCATAATSPRYDASARGDKKSSSDEDSSRKRVNTPNTNLQRSVMWTPWEDRGLEHLRLTCRPEGILADGLIIRVKGGAAFRARYRIRCDARWRVGQGARR